MEDVIQAEIMSGESGSGKELQDARDALVVQQMLVDKLEAEYLERPRGNTIDEGQVSPRHRSPEEQQEAQLVVEFQEKIQNEVSETLHRQTNRIYRKLVFIDSLTDMAFGVLERKNFLRALCISIVFHPFLDYLIFTIVVLNTIVLILTDPDGNDYFASVLNFFNLIFVIIFTVEMCIKLIAFGLVAGKTTYLRNPWNVFDAVVTILGLIALIPGVPSLNIFRAFRLLRLVTLVDGLRAIVTGVFRSFRALVDVGILFAFIFLVFSIIAIQLWKGCYRQYCYIPETNVSALNDNAVDMWNITWNYVPNMNDRLCSNDSSGRLCQNGTSCLPFATGDLLIGYGYIGYDNIGMAIFSLIIVMSTENWAQLMYWVQDCSSTWVWVYFCFYIVLTVFFAVQLFVAIISDELEEAFDELRLEKRKKKKAKKILSLEAAEYIKKGERKLKTPKEHKTLKRFNAVFFRFAPWIKANIVEKDWFEYVMIGLIVLNGAVLCIPFYKMPYGLTVFLNIFNIVITTIFLLEMLLKIYALGANGYFSSHINKADFLIVIASCVDVIVSNVTTISTGVVVFRVIRLMRLFPVLGKRFPSIKRLLTAIKKSLLPAVYLTILLAMILIVFGVLGRQLMQGDFVAYGAPDNRTNWDTTWMAIVSTFGIMTADNWTNTMLAGMKYTGIYMFVYFISVWFIGQFIYQTAFTGILLSQFDDLNVKSVKLVKDENGNIHLVKVRRAHGSDSTTGSTDSGAWSASTMSMAEGGPSAPSSNNSSDFFVADSSEESLETVSSGQIKKKGSLAVLPHTKRLEVVKDMHLKKRNRSKYHSAVMPQFSSLYIFSPDNFFRKILFKIVIHNNFEWFVAICIVLNCVQVGMDQPGLTYTHYAVFRILDYVFVSIFVLEMFMKIIAFGLVMHKGAYLRYFWLIVDCLVTILSVFVLAFPQQKLLSAFRAFRILRLFSKFEGMRIALGSLFKVIPSVVTTMIFTSIVWLIFAIVGVNFFGGQLWYCTDPNVANLSQCVGTFVDASTGLLAPRQWVNQPLNFDDVINGTMTLFVIASQAGWQEITYPLMDVNGVDNQPIPNNKPENAIFSIVFLIVGSYFCINIFTGSIVDRYINEKKLIQGSSFLTPKQSKWLYAQKIMHAAKPKRRIVPPDNFFSRHLFTFLTFHGWFEYFTTVVIVLNAVFLALTWFEEPSALTQVTDIMNYIFVSYFLVEVLLKMLGFGLMEYFGPREKLLKVTWNKFDFIVSVLGLIGIVIPASGAALNVFRLIRCLRLFRLVKKLKGVQTILNTLIESIPKMVHIAVIWLLIFYIFSVVGVSLFSDLYWDGSDITWWANFSTFPFALLTLFRVTTFDGWNDILVGCIMPTTCRSNTDQICGQRSFGIFFIIFLFLQNYIILNIILAIVIESFIENSEFRRHLKSTDEFKRSFRRAWEKFDTELTWYIPLSQFLPFMMEVGPPLGFPKEDLDQNYIIRQVESMAIQYVSDGEQKRIFINDILRGITARSLKFNLRQSDLMKLNSDTYTRGDRIIDKIFDFIGRTRDRKKVVWDLLANYYIGLQQDYVSARKAERPKMEAEHPFLALPIELGDEDDNASKLKRQAKSGGSMLLLHHSRMTGQATVERMVSGSIQSKSHRSGDSSDSDEEKRPKVAMEAKPDEMEHEMISLKDARKGHLRSHDERSELSPRLKREPTADLKEMKKEESKKINFSDLKDLKDEPISPRKTHDYKDELTPRSVYALVKDIKKEIDHLGDKGDKEEGTLADSTKGNVSTKVNTNEPQERARDAKKGASEPKQKPEPKSELGDSMKANTSQPKGSGETRKLGEKKTAGEKKAKKKGKKKDPGSASVSMVSLVSSDPDGSRVNLKKTIGGDPADVVNEPEEI